MELEEKLRALLGENVHPLWLKADSRIFEPLINEFLADKRHRDNKDIDLRQLIIFFNKKIGDGLQNIYDLRRRHTEFIKRHARALSVRERRQYILDYAKYLGATDQQLKEDRQAFSRWFGADTMTDRYLRLYSRSERKIAVYLKHLGNLVAKNLQQDGEAIGHSILWKHLNLESIVKPLLAYDGDSRINIEAFQCLSCALRVLPRKLQQEVVDASTTQYIYRSALESKQQVWIQCEALSLLQSLSPESFYKVLEKRLTQPLPGDDIFVRRHLIRLLGKNLIHIPELAQLFPVIAVDVSPFVRQEFARAICHASNKDVLTWIRHLAIHDESPQVRAVALLELTNHIQKTDLFSSLLQLLIEVLDQEQDTFVLRVALKVIGDDYEKMEPDAVLFWRQKLQPSISKIHTQAENLSVRRWAAQAREKLWLNSDPEARELAKQLQREMAQVSPGEDCELPKNLNNLDEKKLGRVLSILGQQDFGYDISHGLTGSRITRGHRFGFRLWRFLHELRHPAPDKRQAFSHIIGRLFEGSVRAPSAILAELAETKVPGEPLLIPSEGSWRPYLPLVDEVISSLDLKKGKSVCFYTSEGITELSPPESIKKRIQAHILLTTQFSEFARMRNWQETSQSEPSSYVQALNKTGFNLTFTPYQDGDAALLEDPSVRRFFPAVALVPMPELWQRMQDYFFSAYENSLFELAVFTAVAIMFFSGKHLYLNYKIHKIRKNLPLVIGGWGTRGKSGTERIKAALFNALGYGVVCKTTGCEAMFLHAGPNGKMYEMFLFRPYEKATIWEQYDVMRYAVELNADIFLWECMALNPAYVKILQQHWVRDDISTITNTYPDHEDIQGPAGINIPEVMTNFIPKSGILLTTEEQMRPILTHAASKQDTRVSGVGWLESGLLTPDVLQRFPYDEHPDNIALALCLAEELGVEPDFALKEMADRVVADLGVLKTFPIAHLRTRRLQFTNGMSANERFGCLSNWKRLGFDKQNSEEEPGTWISTIVNNRADRIARSRVFASILVADISADHYFLIGSNLQGFQGYIEEAWEEFSIRLTLWPESKEDNPEQIFRQFAQHYRIAFKPELVKERLQAMLTGQPAIPKEEITSFCELWQAPQKLREKLLAVGIERELESIMHHHERNLEEQTSYDGFIEKLSKSDDRDELDKVFKKQLYEWFYGKIDVIEDYYATGDAVINHISEATPPGYLNRIMGMQNIKGTGLDFVYRWQAWNTCYEACKKLRTKQQDVVLQGLQVLSTFREYGLLCEEYVCETLEAVKNNLYLQRESAQAEITIIQSNFELALHDVYKKMNTTRQVGLAVKLARILETFLDAGDAVKRRKIADKIYQDLVTERISIERAITELQKLNKRQKGGWLLNSLSRK